MTNSAIQLLDECQARGITLFMVDGKLRYRAPKGAIDEGLKSALSKHKASVIQLLKPIPTNTICGGCVHLKTFPTKYPGYICEQSFRWCEQRSEGRFPMQKACNNIYLN